MNKRNQYKIGRSIEYKLVNQLRDLYKKAGKEEETDFIILRSCGSHSPFDVILFDFKDSEVHCFQVKETARGYYDKKEFRKFQCIPRIFSVWKHYFVWKKGIDWIVTWNEDNSDFNI